MQKSSRLIYIILATLIVLPYLGFIGLNFWYRHKVSDINNAAFLVISKEEMRIRLIDYKGREILRYGIACGKNFGDKEKRGDLKTPEGIFHISEIVNSSNWKHDFGDGKGEISGAYGPYFMRLEVPGHKGIGIHGTHKPESIGTRDTEGCIRLHNEELEKLVNHCHVGMAVFITPSYKDVIKSGKVDSLKVVIKKHEDLMDQQNKKSRRKQTQPSPEKKTTTTQQIKVK